jgi:hypothetical protein
VTDDGVARIRKEIEEFESEPVNQKSFSVELKSYEWVAITSRLKGYDMTGLGALVFEYAVNQLMGQFRDQLEQATDDQEREPVITPTAWLGPTHVRSQGKQTLCIHSSTTTSSCHHSFARGCYQRAACKVPFRRVAGLASRNEAVYKILSKPSRGRTRREPMAPVGGPA